MKALITWFRNIDQFLLFGCILILASVWGFLAVSDEVHEGDTQEFDERIVRSLRQPNDPSKMIGPPWFAEVARDVTALGGVFVLVLVTVLVAGFLAIQKRYHILTFLIVSTVGGLAMSTLLKRFFDRPRPEVVPHLSIIQTSSFPSGHSMLSAVVYLTLAALLARLVDRRLLKTYIVVAAMLISVLVGVSRVFVGVHYPTDVLAGWSAGLCWALLCSVVARWLQSREVLETTVSSPEET